MRPDTTQDDATIARAASGDRVAAAEVLARLDGWIRRAARSIHSRAWREERSDCLQVAIEIVLERCRHHRPGTGYGGLTQCCSWYLPAHLRRYVRAEIHRPGVWLSVPAATVLEYEDRDGQTAGHYRQTEARILLGQIRRHAPADDVRQTIDAALGAIRDGYEPGYSGDGFRLAVAARLGCRHQTVYNRLRRLGRRAS